MEYPHKNSSIICLLPPFINVKKIFNNNIKQQNPPGSLIVCHIRIHEYTNWKKIPRKSRGYITNNLHLVSKKNKYNNSHTNLPQPKRRRFFFTVFYWGTGIFLSFFSYLYISLDFSPCPKDWKSCVFFNFLFLSLAQLG